MVLKTSDVETGTGITESQEAARLTKLRFLDHHFAVEVERLPSVTYVRADFCLWLVNQGVRI